MNRAVSLLSAVNNKRYHKLQTVLSDSNWTLAVKTMLAGILCITALKCPAYELVTSSGHNGNLAYVSIDPSSLLHEVKFGGDAKLTVKNWSDGATEKIASLLHEDIRLDMLRIPLYAMRTADDPFYENLIKVLNAVRDANRHTTFFASVANGDGHKNNNLHNRNKFPESLIDNTGNIYGLNLEKYAQLWDEYLTMLDENGFSIDYIGPFNEDPAKYSDYRKVFRKMQRRGDAKRVGIESWALTTAIRKAADMENQLDIVGSHFFDDKRIDRRFWDAHWTRLIKATSRSVWFTEATRFRVPDSIDNLLEGFAHSFSPIRSGVERVIFYQTVPRFVDYDGTIREKKYTALRNLVNNAHEKMVVPVSSTNVNISAIAFASDDKLSLHVLNLSNEKNTIRIKLESGYNTTGAITRHRWCAEYTEHSGETAEVDNYWYEELPSRSYLHFCITLDKSAGQGRQPAESKPPNNR